MNKNIQNSKGSPSPYYQGHRPKRRRLNIGGVEERTGVHRQTIWRWYKAGRFPPPHYLGQARLWFEDEIEVWEESRMRQRAEEKTSQDLGKGWEHTLQAHIAASSGRK